MNEDKKDNIPIIQIKYDRQQFKQLVQMMIHQYQRIAPHHHTLPSNIKQIYISIMLAKQKQMQTQRNLWQDQFRRQASRLYRQNQEFIHHATQRQIQSLTKKDKMVLSRLIDLKNQKNRQLVGLSYKYDQLLDLMRKKIQRQNQLEQRIKNLETQRGRLIKTNGVQQRKQIELNTKISKMIKKFNILMGQMLDLRKSFFDFKNAVIFMIRSYQKSTKETLDETITRYNLLINSLQTTIKIKVETLDHQKAQHLKSVSQNGKIIQKLVQYLSQETKFKKRQTQDSYQWFQQFQRYKKAQRQYLQLELNQSDVFSSGQDSKTSQFIRQQRRKNQNYLAQYIPLQGLSEYSSNNH